uniref:Selenoprotein P N-terminal domain-containing protein n=3 Tax=Poecilia TaxID=8080 RepID=A0A096M1E4_POEFO
HFCLVQASRIGRLRTKLRRSNITDVSFVIVNEQDAASRALYWELKKRAPTGVPVYQQAANQTDVWEVLDGDKDDFLIYDRCGLLTFHVVLPYSSLQNPYVEAAIRATYLGDICNCSAISTRTPSIQGTIQTPDEGADPTEETQTIPHHYHHHFSFSHHQPAPRDKSQDQHRSAIFPAPYHPHHAH